GAGTVVRHGNRGIAERRASLRRPGAARSNTRAWLRHAGLPPLLGAELILIVEARREHSRELACRGASGEARLGGAPALAEVARIGACFNALHLLPGDDIHHTGDRIGA